MSKHNHIIKTLQNTRVEYPIDGDEVEALVDRLTSLSDELEHIREASDPTLLTERQAEVIVRWHGMGQSAEEIADVLGIGTARVYEIRHAAEDKLLAADATLSLINKLRRSIRPDPYTDAPERDLIGVGDADESAEHGQLAVDVIDASEVSLESVLQEWQSSEDAESDSELDVREHPELWDELTHSERFRRLSPSDYTASVRLPEDAGDIKINELVLLSTTMGGDPAEVQSVSYNDTLGAAVYKAGTASVLVVHDGIVVVGDDPESVRTATEDALSMIEQCGVEIDTEAIAEELEMLEVGDIKPHSRYTKQTQDGDGGDWL